MQPPPGVQRTQAEFPGFANTYTMVPKGDVLTVEAELETSLLRRFSFFIFWRCLMYVPESVLTELC